MGQGTVVIAGGERFELIRGGEIDPELERYRVPCLGSTLNQRLTVSTVLIDALMCRLTYGEPLMCRSGSLKRRTLFVLARYKSCERQQYDGITCC